MPNKIKTAVKKIKSIQQKAKAVEKKVKAINNVIHAPAKSLGGLIGGKLGSKSIGSKIGGFIGNITGTGDYKVLSNSISKSSTISDGNVPQFQVQRRGTRIAHREFIGNIVASSVAGQFKVQKFPVNPGLFSTFPWLSPIASQYDQYKLNGMVVCINSRSSTYSGTSSLGSITVATDYDVADSPYDSKLKMLNSEFAVSGNAAQSLIHPIECAPKERPQSIYYTRTTGIPSGNDLRFYDFCNFFVATAGCSANQVVAELWITYDITFYKPQLEGGLLGRTLFSHHSRASSGIDVANPFGNLVVNGYTNFSIEVNGEDITFPPELSGATFLLSYHLYSTTSTLSGTAITYSSGCKAGPPLDVADSLIHSGTGNTNVANCTVQLTGDDNTVQTLTWPLLTGVTSAFSVDLYIVQINPFN